MPLFGLANNLFWIPDLKAVLHHDLPQGLTRYVTPLQQGQVKGVIGLFGHAEADFKAFSYFPSVLITAAVEQVLEQQLIFGYPLQKVCKLMEFSGNKL